MLPSLRRLFFRLYYWPQWFVELPLSAFVGVASRRTALGSYAGIAISSGTFTRVEGKVFLEATIGALQLIERIDLRRFRRIQRHISLIVHCELPAGACYRRLGRICQIDFGRYDFLRDHTWYLHCYASALVHEATHGEMFSRYMANSARNRLRIERLCHGEERRFLRRLDTTERLWSEQIAGVFDEQYYSQFYQAGWFAKRLRVLKRLRELRR